MTNLITGAGGFIGRHLIEHLRGQFPGQSLVTVGLHAPLVAASENVRHFPCEMLDEAALAQILLQVKPDRVYHLAGSSKVSSAIGMPEYFNNNFLTTISLLRAIQPLQKEVRVFFASSVHVYGNQDETVSEDSSIKPVGFYGFSKYLSEAALRAHVQKLPHLRVVAGRLYSCIGPGQGEGFVASDLCRKIARLPASGAGVLQTGPLSSFRRFLDVRDAVKIFPLLLDTNFESRFEIFNIASPHEMQVRKMVEVLLKISGRTPQIESTEDAGNPFTGLKLSMDKLTTTLPSVRFRPIEETLSDMWSITEKH